MAKNSVFDVLDEKDVNPAWLLEEMWQKGYLDLKSLNRICSSRDDRIAEIREELAQLTGEPISSRGVSPGSPPLCTCDDGSCTPKAKPAKAKAKKAPAKAASKPKTAPKAKPAVKLVAKTAAKAAPKKTAKVPVKKAAKDVPTPSNKQYGGLISAYILHYVPKSKRPSAWNQVKKLTNDEGLPQAYRWLSGKFPKE